MSKPPILSGNGNLSQLSMLQRFYQLRNKSIKKGFIPWIERLLKVRIADDRKYCIWRVHVPYLINVKHLSPEQTFSIIENWLHECDKLESLDFNIESRVNGALARVGNFFPIGLNALKEENRRLYDIVVFL